MLRLDQGLKKTQLLQRICPPISQIKCFTKYCSISESKGKLEHFRQASWLKSALSPFCLFSSVTVFNPSKEYLDYVFVCFPCRHHGPPAPWGSGSQSCLSGTTSSRLGYLRADLTASGWRAFSTRRASWQQWNRYTWPQSGYPILSAREETRWRTQGQAGTQPQQHTQVDTQSLTGQYKH